MNKTLMKKAEYSFHPTICHCCGSAVTLTPKTEIKPSARKGEMVYLCNSGDCGAYVGCRSGRNTAIGSLAKYETRLARGKAFAAMKELMQSKSLGGEREVYAWMRNILNLPHGRHGISWLRENECNKLVQEIEFHLSTKRQESAKKHLASLRVMLAAAKSEPAKTVETTMKINNIFSRFTELVRG